MEQSPVGSSASNGVVEKAIQSVEQQVRVLESAVEGRWSVKLETRHPAIPWITEYAAVMLNRFEVGHDGKTAYERNKGKKAKVWGMEFGEAILWKRRPVGGALGKLSCLWEDGLYLGIRGQSGELIVSDREGVVEDQDGAEEADRGPLAEGRLRDDPEDAVG